MLKRVIDRGGRGNNVEQGERLNQGEIKERRELRGEQIIKKNREKVLDLSITSMGRILKGNGGFVGRLPSVLQGIVCSGEGGEY